MRRILLDAPHERYRTRRSRLLEHKIALSPWNVSERVKLGNVRAQNITICVYVMIQRDETRCCRMLDSQQYAKQCTNTKKLRRQQSERENRVALNTNASTIHKIGRLE